MGWVSLIEDIEERRGRDYHYSIGYDPARLNPSTARSEATTPPAVPRPFCEACGGRIDDDSDHWVFQARAPHSRARHYSLHVDCYWSWRLENYELYGTSIPPESDQGAEADRVLAGKEERRAVRLVKLTALTGLDAGHFGDWPDWVLRRVLRSLSAGQAHIVEQRPGGPAVVLVPKR